MSGLLSARFFFFRSFSFSSFCAVADRIKSVTFARYSKKRRRYLEDEKTAVVVEEEKSRRSLSSSSLSSLSDFSSSSLLSGFLEEGFFWDLFINWIYLGI